MPAIVFDFEEISKNMLGDDWWQKAQQRDDACDRAEQQCEPKDARYIPAPCTKAPTPPAPCGQAVQERAAGGMNLQQAQCNQQAAARNLGIAPAPGGIVARDPHPAWMKELPPGQGGGDPRSAIMQLIHVIDYTIYEESQKLDARMNQLHCLLEQAQTRRARVQYENTIDDAKAQYHLTIAPMQRQKNWLIEQLTATMVAEPVCVAPVDYECDPVREVDVAGLKKGYKPGRRA